MVSGGGRKERRVRVAEALGQGVIVELEAVVLEGGGRDDGRLLGHRGRWRGGGGRGHRVLERHHGAGGHEALRRGVVAAHDGDELDFRSLVGRLAAGVGTSAAGPPPSPRTPPKRQNSSCIWRNICPLMCYSGFFMCQGSLSREEGVSRCKSSETAFGAVIGRRRQSLGLRAPPPSTPGPFSRSGPPANQAVC